MAEDRIDLERNRSISFDHHEIVMISSSLDYDSTDGSYKPASFAVEIDKSRTAPDSDWSFTSVDLSEYFTDEYFNEALPRDVVQRLEQEHAANAASVKFGISFLSDKSYFSKQWNDGVHPVQIKHFDKIRREGGLTTYLGPLSEIPLSWWGKGTFELRLDNEAIRFKTFAERKIWTLGKRYWAYVDLYSTGELERFDGHALHLFTTHDPNRFCEDHGTYLVYPKV